MDTQTLNGIKRVLFDFDGTLFDTQKLHAEVESRLVLSEHGLHISPTDLSARFAGKPTEEVFVALVGCDKKEAKRLFELKWDMLFARSREAKELANLGTLFEWFLAKDISIAIGTASVVEWPKVVLAQHGLLRYFNHRLSIIGGDMVERGKPHPDIWLYAADDTPPATCLVVEDGVFGIEGAISANMRSCLLLPKIHPAALAISSVDDLRSLP